MGNNEPVSIADEVPFEIPESWEWCRLGELFSTIMGQSPKGNTVSIANDGIEFHQGKICFGDMYLEPSEQTTSAPTKIAPSNSVLLCVRAPVGKVNITKREICIGRGLCAVIPHANMTAEYTYYLLETYEEILKKQATGTTFVAVTGEVVKKQLIPVPPIQEQQRIVAKIRELLPFIVEYNKKETKISELNTSFPDRLKKSILLEAVMGKLVPQDENDEPASALLERIREEKKHLIAEGKLKKDKHESIIYRRDNSHYEKLDGTEYCIDAEVPFDIPDSWEWERFGNIMINRDSERIPLSVDERSKLDKIFDYYGASGVIDKVDNYLFDKPLLLIGEDGANLLNRSTPIAFIAKGKYWVNNHAHVLDAPTGILLEYISLFINSMSLAKYVTGTAQPKMNQANMNSILVAIPPTEEQVRIIAELDKIISVCSRL